MRNKKLGLIAILVSVAASDILAGTITNYAVGDVLVCFRKGSIDMVVDAGPVSTFTGASHNQRIPITQYTGAQLAPDLGTNGVSWSAFTYLGDSTLFMTRARPSVNVQSTPWLSESQPAQSGVASEMATIPPGALDEFNLLVYPESIPTAVVEEDSSSDNPNYTDGNSYHYALTGAAGGFFDGKFEGNPENTTSNNFTSKALVQRSDFYQLTPTGSFNQSGTWLGYFELNTNGAMTYVAYPNSTPSVTGFSRSGATATISYISGMYGTYNLIATNKISAPISTWPVVGGNLSSGDNSIHTVQDTDSVNTNKFYMIEGQ